MSVHTLTVYFPLGLLFVSVLFDLLARQTGREEMARVGWWALVSGTAFLLLALATGALTSSVGDAVTRSARRSVDVHQTLGYVSAVLFILLAVWRLGGRGRIHAGWRAVYLTGAIIALVLLFATIYMGVRTVYVHAVGVSDATLERALEARERPTEPLDEPARVAPDTIVRDTL